jgi:hypothetical protein
MIEESRNLDRLATLAADLVSRFRDNDEATMVRLLEPIEEQAAQLQAGTPREALFQLLLAAADIAELGQTQGWEQHDLTQRCERIETCVISALHVFERLSGIDRDELGGAYFASRH